MSKRELTQGQRNGMNDIFEKWANMTDKEKDEGLKERERIMAEEKLRPFPLTEKEIEQLKKKDVFNIISLKPGSILVLQKRKNSGKHGNSTQSVRKRLIKFE